MSNKPVGFYCWGGPGLVRMTNLKYFSPQIDGTSLYGSYTLPYLKKLKKLFGITDFWLTYSWGFGDTTEAEDKAYALSTLKNFQRLNIRTHAYIQGPNLVYQDFSDKDWFCRDERNQLITYHRGRKVCCVNNPHFKRYFTQKIREACQHDFSGIFVDNLQMGQLGIPYGEQHSSNFVGCACRFCKKIFFKQTGLEIPRRLSHRTERTKRYLDFRVQSLSKFLQDVALLVHKHGKVFGTNCFDPQFEPTYMYGIDLQVVHNAQDYILFENHSLPQPHKFRNNYYIEQLIQQYQWTKPVFVVSYKKGIGLDAQYTQSDIDLLFTEAAHSSFSVCLKGSEFVTQNTWHNLRLDNLTTPNILTQSRQISTRKSGRKRRLLVRFPFTRWLVANFVPRFYTGYMENALIRKSFSFLQHHLVS